MKTIWDAVNELQGELTGAAYANHHKENYKKVDVFLHKVMDDRLSQSPVGSYVIYSCDESHRGDVKFICTTGEFNALVAEMSLGLDVNPINEGYYHKYLAADKQELELAPVIDWDSAPDGKNYALANKDKGLVEFFREKPVFDGDNSTPCWANHENEDLHLKSKWELHERPTKQQPVYTQEMCDNGELPSVGMSFLCGQEMASDVRITEFGGEEVIVVGINKEGDRDIITFYHTSLGFGCGIFFSSWVRPLPPKLELIDGEAYQFDIDSLVVNGIYRKMDNKFYNYNGDFGVEYCNNIKPLTASD